MKSSIKSNKGFSLIELMIVVAIIGILSAIAVPNFQRFAAKSRQAEAKGNLAGYYQAAQASFAEYGYYAGNFVAIGFRPDGTLNYRISAAQNRNPPAGMPNDTGCVATNSTCSGGYATWTEAGTSSTSGPASPATAADVNDADFDVAASGRIGSTTVDEWRIDQNKSLTSASSGLP